MIQQHSLRPDGKDPQKREIVQTDRKHREPQAIVIKGRCLKSEIFDALHSISLEEAGKIAQLFKNVYGDHYISTLFTDPFRIRQAIAAGEWIAITLKDEHEETIGHAGIIPSSRGRVELGRTVVDQSARGLGLSKILNAARFHYIESLPEESRPAAVDTESVTTHDITQRTLQAKPFCLTPVGLYLAKYPDVFSSGNRESVLHMTRIYDPTLKESRAVYVPEEYKELVTEIYSSLDCDRSVETVTSAFHKTTKTGDVKVSQESDSQMAKVEPDPDCPTGEILDAAQSLLHDDDLEYCAVEVPIGCADTDALFSSLKSLGYSFAGLSITADGDFVVMQMSRNIPRNGALKIYGETAATIAGFVCGDS